MPLWDRVGRPRALAASGPVIAVGTALGAVVVFQAPSSSSMSATAGPVAVLQQAVGGERGGGTGGPAPAPAPLVLGEARGEAEAVTALGFSTVLSPSGAGDTATAAASSGLWLLAGHASGTIVAWDLQRRPARQVLSIGEHNKRVPSSAPYMLLGGVITFVGARTHTPCARYLTCFSPPPQCLYSRSAQPARHTRELLPRTRHFLFNLRRPARAGRVTLFLVTTAQNQVGKGGRGTGGSWHMPC